jgi:hypothetical protein
MDSYDDLLKHIESCDKNYNYCDKCGYCGLNITTHDCNKQPDNSTIPLVYHSHSFTLTDNHGFIIPSINNTINLGNNPNDYAHIFTTYSLSSSTYQPSGYVNFSRAREFYINLN